MIAGSLFSGVGGMDLGLQRAGFDHAFFCEIDPWRRDVLRAHWPGTSIHEDVRDVACVRRPEPSGVERTRADATGGAHGGHPVDLLCGGFPCQDVSVAGKRAGLAGARSGLFHEYARIAEALRPAWLLIENVPGLLSSNDGRDFGVVLGTLADLGYGVAWRVLDAQHFGVPQRRRRIFIVAHSGGDAGPALRALCESCEGHPTPRECSWTRTPTRTRGGAELAGSLLAKRGKNGGGLSVEEIPNLVVGTLQAQGNGRGWRVDAEGAAEGHLVAYMPYRTLAKDGGIDAGYAPRPVIDALHGPTGNKEPLLRSAASVRRLTPVECERLMSWPDSWTAPNGIKAPDSRRYAACGDGVVANVAEWIGIGIKAAA